MDAHAVSLLGRLLHTPGRGGRYHPELPDVGGGGGRIGGVKGGDCVRSGVWDRPLRLQLR